MDSTPGRAFPVLAAILAVALLGPPAVAGLSLAGVPPAAGALILIGCAGGWVWKSGRTIGTQMSHLRHLLGTPGLAICALALALACFYNIRLSTFMLDPTRADLSVLPGRKFFREHSCLTAYTEAARLAALHVNVYELERYANVSPSGDVRDRYISSFVVDPYQYPPPFLFLPAAAVSAGLEFLTIRTGWFFAQTALLFAAMVFLARWVGDLAGVRLLVLMPFVWLSPQVRLGLQMGNFQPTALALAVLAMVAFHQRRVVSGGAALGFAALSKIFPGVLGLVLIAARRWRAVTWTVACSAALAVLAWLAVGSTPFADFLAYQLPRMQSGEAFPWIEAPGMAPINQSIYGLVTKLRAFGVPFTGETAAARASTAYAVVVFGLAWLAGLRLNRRETTGEVDRLREAGVWLSLLNLASFRSPFVPDAYGLAGTVWLLLIIAARQSRPAAMWIGLAALGAAFSITLDGGLVPDPVPIWLVAATLAIQLAALGVNLRVVLRA